MLFSSVSVGPSLLDNIVNRTISDGAARQKVFMGLNLGKTKSRAGVLGRFSHMEQGLDSNKRAN
jgi:hypothetical protein